MLKLITGDDLALLSHPPHLDLNSRVTSALIPFCGFKTSMVFSESTTWLPDISYPICSAFKPTILEGQLCYKLSMKKPSGQGKENELMLLLDYNEDRSLQVPYNNNNTDDVSSTETLNLDTALKSIQGVSAKIHINTLSPFIGFGGGIYSITDVKRMTAKEDFLRMSLKDSTCEVEMYEDCRTRKLLEECMCVPWEALGYQVKPHSSSKLCFLLSGHKKMQPKR